jgi:hypothetical protein
MFGALMLVYSVLAVVDQSRLRPKTDVNVKTSLYSKVDVEKEDAEKAEARVEDKNNGVVSVSAPAPVLIPACAPVELVTVEPVAVGPASQSDDHYHNYYHY